MKIVRQIKLEGGIGQVRNGKLFQGTIIHKILEANSSFHGK